jgi:hypothetical protein
VISLRHPLAAKADHRESLCFLMDICKQEADDGTVALYRQKVASLDHG